MNRQEAEPLCGHLESGSRFKRRLNCMPSLNNMQEPHWSKTFGACFLPCFPFPSTPPFHPAPPTVRRGTGAACPSGSGQPSSRAIVQNRAQFPWREKP